MKLPILVYAENLKTYLVPSMASKPRTNIDNQRYKNGKTVIYCR